MAELMESYTSGEAPSVPEEAYRRASRAVLAEQRRKGFRQRCPAQFAVPIDRRKMLAPPAAVEAALAWQATCPGLWLWSERTGQGKTRILWQLHRRAYVDMGRSVCEFTGQRWADQVWHHHMEGSTEHLWAWVARWDVLMFDDIDKVNLSDERQARAMRELFDLIYRRSKPAVVTANWPASWITDVLGESAGRRAAEAFTELRFE